MSKSNESSYKFIYMYEKKANKTKNYSSMHSFITHIIKMYKKFKCVSSFRFF